MYNKKACMLMGTEQLGSYLNLAKVLRDNSYGVKIICLRKKHQPRTESIAEGIVLQTVIKYGPWQSPFMSILNPFTSFPLLIKALSTHADIYWGHGFIMLPTLIILRVFRKKVIYDVGDDNPSNFSYAIYNKLRIHFISSFTERLFRIFERYCIKRVNYVITLTESLKRDRETYNSNIRAVYYCPDSSFYQALPDKELSHEYNGRDILVHSGTISFNKAFREIFEAFEFVRMENSNALLLLVGGIFKPDENEINKMIEGRTDILLTGWQTYKDMPKYISLGKVGLAVVKPTNYSYSISLPFKMIEQMACGLPIIAPTGLPEIEHILESAQCGLLVDINNPCAVAKVIIQLLINEQKRKEMASNALAYIRKYHNINTFERETMSVFNSVATQK